MLFSLSNIKDLRKPEQVLCDFICFLFKIILKKQQLQQSHVNVSNDNVSHSTLVFPAHLYGPVVSSHFSQKGRLIQGIYRRWLKCRWSGREVDKPDPSQKQAKS